MKRQTIRNHKDFLVLPGSPSAHCSCFVVRSKPASRKDSRYGIVVSKRLFRLATQRNRAKRLMRDWIAANESVMLPNLDYIFIVRPAILVCNREEGRKKTATLVKKVSK
jgi:ribonuclease P protein component